MTHMHARICREIITRAADAVGGEDALARLLSQDPEDVRAWAKGTRLAPLSVYLKALDILSGPPSGRPRS
jgi:hypothetical protein